MDLGIVSSDDVIAAYKKQLAEAHDRVAVLDAQMAKATRRVQELEETASLHEYDRRDPLQQTEISA